VSVNLPDDTRNAVHKGKGKSGKKKREGTIPHVRGRPPYAVSFHPGANFEQESAHGPSKKTGGGGEKVKAEARKKVHQWGASKQHGKQETTCRLCRAPGHAQHRNMGTQEAEAMAGGEGEGNARIGIGDPSSNEKMRGGGSDRLQHVPPVQKAPTRRKNLAKQKRREN